MFGKSEEEKRREMQQKEQERQRRHSMQQAGLQQAQGGQSGPEMLQELSLINDLSTLPGETLDHWISKIVSTTKLSEEDIRSDEWVKEYVLLMYKSQFPPEYGLSGHVRAYALDDTSEKRDPLGTRKETQAEAFKHTAGQALARSESGFVTEKASHQITEAISHDDLDSDSSGGLLGKLGLK